MTDPDPNIWRPELEDVLDMMPNGLVALDTDCRVRLWNAAMEKLTGYGADEILGKPCSFLECMKCAGRGPDGKNNVRECSTRRPGDTLVENMECSIRGKSGEMIPVLKNARVMRDDEGGVLGIIETVTDLRYRKQLEEELQAWRGTVSSASGMGRLVGNSHVMREVYERIRLASQSDATVLIHGDTGTGKELAADAIHGHSARHDKPFIKINCSALPESLLESELFGHVRGAFTGAVSDKVGRFEAADGGTLFLDEIGDISPLIQLKLLRVIQERTFERVGEIRPRQTDVRVIAATHRNLRDLVNQGKFREDFYYRIKVFDIRMPALMERKEDIPILERAFLERFRRATGKQIESVSDEVNHAFMDYCWSGNVRELENAIEHAFVTCEGNEIQLEDLPAEIRTAERRVAECRDRLKHRNNDGTASRSRFARGSREELLQILQECGWNKAEAARRLGVERTTIWRRMKNWGIELEAPRE
jgi:two-component system response regulator HydG